MYNSSEVPGHLEPLSCELALFLRHQASRRGLLDRDGWMPAREALEEVRRIAGERADDSGRKQLPRKVMAAASHASSRHGDSADSPDSAHIAASFIQRATLDDLDVVVRRSRNAQHHRFETRLVDGLLLIRATRGQKHRSSKRLQGVQNSFTANDSGSWPALESYTQNSFTPPGGGSWPEFESHGRSWRENTTDQRPTPESQHAPVCGNDGDKEARVFHQRAAQHQKCQEAQGLEQDQVPGGSASHTSHHQHVPKAPLKQPQPEAQGQEQNQVPSGSASHTSHQQHAPPFKAPPKQLQPVAKPAPQRFHSTLKPAAPQPSQPAVQQPTEDRSSPQGAFEGIWTLDGKRVAILSAPEKSELRWCETGAVQRFWIWNEELIFENQESGTPSTFHGKLEGADTITWSDGDVWRREKGWESWDVVKQRLESDTAISGPFQPDLGKPERCIALADFDGTQWGEEYLSICEDETLLVQPKDQEGWRFGQAEQSSRHGWLPKAFVRRCTEK
eukprot:TRINITY_DN34226_c0_g1_i1.p1 TRINITY_DN34226_c0_g1~~TRINITY_DN34226_c0_g1_i1.p1  ORF type:complete len:504 (+),score=82.29 TRINITY_DN34226_c0_g1_i1:69-1580(+)